MKTVAGIFLSSDDAQRAATQLESIGVARNDITVLTPGASQRQVDAVPTDEGEQPGMGKAIGAVVGGAVGAASGVPIGAALVSLMVPGIGPVIASGILGAALLGAGGAALGGALETNLSEGLPKDEIFVYEDALRRGRSVLIALVRDEAQAEEARIALLAARAGSVDEARDQWWIGLSDVDKVGYTPDEEETYRRGFEAALHRDARGRSFEDARDLLARRYPDLARAGAFRRGYEGGQAYHRRFAEPPAVRPDLKKTA
jgi:hypothetical protein